MTPEGLWWWWQNLYSKMYSVLNVPKFLTFYRAHNKRPQPRNRIRFYGNRVRFNTAKVYR